VRSPDATTSRWADVAPGVRLHCVEAGPADGPPVVLLHGFPEFHLAWRHQIPALARAGHRVIAPDLRGYGLSSKPPRVADYRLEHLAGDVAALIAGVARDGRASVVGHDWGGVVAWCAGMWHPERVARLAILNAPHPAAYAREVRRFPPVQLLKSWYAVAFQVPWLPEALLRWNDFAVARRLLALGPARGGGARVVQQYVNALARPGALTAAINYYRAAGRRPPTAVPRHRLRPVAAPTLVIWGDRDAYLVPQLADGLEPWAPGVRVERLPEGTHWLHHECAGRVNGLLAEFMR
jgi:pimeloyl-ACP methyl ester carboxylesterase